MPKTLKLKLDLRDAADYKMTIPARRKGVVAGTDAVYTIKSNALTGFDGNTDISVSGLPTGASAVIADSTLAAGSSTTVTVDTAGVTGGSYEFWINTVSSDAGDYDWLTVDNAGRIIDWTYCGIPGGIPIRETVYTTLSAGATATEIATAISDCPSGQVVKLNAGTYNNLGAIELASKQGVTLRGAGAGQTILNFTSGSYLINTNQDSFSDTKNLASGYAKGSTSVVVTVAPSEWNVGDLLLFNQNDDDSLILTSSGHGVEKNCFEFMARITSVSDTTINFTPPLPFALTAGLSPTVSHAILRASLLGIEDLTINGYSGAQMGIAFHNSDRCWAYRVEVKNITDHPIHTWYSLQCEIRKCYLHDIYDYPANPDGYGVQWYVGTTYNLAVDNIIDHVAYDLMGQADTANAWVYNYTDDTDQNTGTFQSGTNCNHTPYGVMTLFEGNMCMQWQNDGYHGSMGYQVIFRNWYHGLHSTKTLNRKMIDICRGGYYHTVVGNVLGDSTWEPTQYLMTGEPGYDNSVIYRLGYPNMMNNGLDESVAWPDYGLTYPDAQVAATLLRHGNYDYYNDAAVWDGSITSHSIPTSLIYSSKPSWFGSLDWPPIGPDVDGYVTDIPAKVRWDTYVVSEDLSDLF